MKWIEYCPALLFVTQAVMCGTGIVQFFLPSTGPTISKIVIKILILLCSIGAAFVLSNLIINFREAYAAYNAHVPIPTSAAQDSRSMAIGALCAMVYVSFAPKRIHMVVRAYVAFLGMAFCVTSLALFFLTTGNKSFLEFIAVPFILALLALCWWGWAALQVGKQFLAARQAR